MLINLFLDMIKYTSMLFVLSLRSSGGHGNSNIASDSHQT